MVQTVKIGLKAFSPFNQNIETYFPNLHLSYRTVPHADKKQTLSTLMGRKIRAPITMPFAREEKVWYKRNKETEPERAVVLEKMAANVSLWWPI